MSIYDLILDQVDEMLAMLNDNAQVDVDLLVNRLKEIRSLF